MTTLYAVAVAMFVVGVVADWAVTRAVARWREK